MMTNLYKKYLLFIFMVDNNTFFSKNDKNKNSLIDEKINSQSKAIIKLSQRMKDLEDGNENYNDKIELVEKTSNDNLKKVFSQIKILKDENLKLKTKISLIEEFNKRLLNKLKILASKDKVLELEKYIDFWEPVKFITREEMKDYREKIKVDLEKIVEKFLKD